MQAPQDVQAMLKVASLGWGAKRISRERGCSRNTVRSCPRQGGWGKTPRACAPDRARAKGKDEGGMGHVKRHAIAGLRFACLEELPAHLAHRGCDAVVAFLGIDLRPQDSREHKGVRRLSKRGDACARKLLFTASMAAVGCDAHRRHRQ